MYNVYKLKCGMFSIGFFNFIEFFKKKEIVG